MPIDWTLAIPIIVGASITFQGATGSLMGKLGGNAFSTFTIFAVGLIPGIITYLVDTRGGSTVNYSAGFQSAPWFSYLGGFMGPFAVFSIVASIPKIGASLMFTVMVCAQLASAVLFATFGWIGLPKHAPTTGGIVGLCMIIVSVIIIGSSKPTAAADAVADVVVEEESSPVHTVIVESAAAAKNSNNNSNNNNSPQTISPKLQEEDDHHSAERGSLKPPPTSIGFAEYAFYLILAAFAGASGSLQAGMNSTLTLSFNSPSFSTFLVSVIGQVPCVIAFALEYRKTPTDFKAVWRETPWWCWTGGIISYGIVMMFAYLPQHLDISVLQAALVTAQVLSAMVADHYGLWRLQVNRITVTKAAGTVLLVAGVVVLSVLN
ncbi:hypothetical protein HDU77_003218 [Chytriomyces hyalinus]|nr:hypothetical protein HDU77_003218 [Chytriomyces hyalinus]